MSMAEVEVKPRVIKESLQERAALQHCAELLCQRQHEACLLALQPFVENLKLGLSGWNSRRVEYVSILLIQALAELGQGQEVVSKVIDIYGGWEKCSARVAMACISLHASLGNFGSSEALAQSWLTCPDNLARADYGQVCRTFVLKALLPRQLDPSAFLRACPGLSEEELQNIEREAEHTTKTRKEKGEEELKAVEVKERQAAEAAKAVETDFSDLGTSLISWFARWLRKLADLALAFKWHSVLIAVACTAAFLAKFTVLPESSLPPVLLQLWGILRGAWRMAFAPYHLMSRSS